MATLITNPSNSSVNLPAGFFQDSIGPHEGVIVSDAVADVTAQLAGLGLTAATLDAGSGDLSGPGSSTDNALMRWDGATGLLAQNSTWTLSDTGEILGVSTTVAGNVLDLTFNSITNGNGILLRSNSVTSGTMLQVLHTSTDATQIRSLARFDQGSGAAAQCIGVYIGQSAPFVGLWLDQGADGNAIRVSPASNAAQHVVNIANADSLTTGSILNLVSNSASAGSRNLVSIVNDNAAASGATALYVQQDADAAAIDVVSASLTDHSVLISASALTTGSALRVVQSSATANVRSVATIRNGQAGATSCVALLVEQVSTAEALTITQIANGPGIGLTTAGTNASAIFVVCNSLTTGQIARLYSDSASASARVLLSVTNDNVAAVNAVPLAIAQDANQVAIDLLSAGAAIRFAEVATVPAGAPAAGKGTTWVRNDAPNRFVFTGDTGVDHVLEDSRTLGSEIDTGKTYTAGQPIFKQAFGYANVAAATPTAVGTMSVAPTHVVSMGGSHNEGVFRLPFPSYAAQLGAAFNVSSYTNGASVIVETGSSRSGTNSGVIVVEYTKV